MRDRPTVRTSTDALIAASCGAGPGMPMQERLRAAPTSPDVPRLNTGGIGGMAFGRVPLPAPHRHRAHDWPPDVPGMTGDFIVPVPAPGEKRGTQVRSGCHGMAHHRDAT